MSQQPAQPRDLDAIETRAAYLDEYALLADEPLQADLDQLTGTDVPAMAAELRQARAEIHRLRTELAAERAYGQRLREQHDLDVKKIQTLRTRNWELERPAIEAKRGEVQLSMLQLAAQAREDRDYESEAVILQRLADREEQWEAEDAARTQPAVETHVVADDSNNPEHTDTEPAEACGKCRRPFDPTDTAFDGRARYYLTPYCRSCVSRCHESTDAFHRCVICE